MRYDEAEKINGFRFGVVSFYLLRVGKTSKQQQQLKKTFANIDGKYGECSPNHLIDVEMNV